MVPVDTANVVVVGNSQIHMDVPVTKLASGVYDLSVFSFEPGNQLKPKHLRFEILIDKQAR